MFESVRDVANIFESVRDSMPAKHPRRYIRSNQAAAQATSTACSPRHTIVKRSWLNWSTGSSPGSLRAAALEDNGRPELAHPNVACLAKHAPQYADFVFGLQIKQRTREQRSPRRKKNRASHAGINLAQAMRPRRCRRTRHAGRHLSCWAPFESTQSWHKTHIWIEIHMQASQMAFAAALACFTALLICSCANFCADS